MFLVFGYQVLVFVDKYAAHFFIGEPAMAPDYGLEKIGTPDICLPVKRNVNRNCQAVFLGNQTAQVVGQLLREHGYYGIGKIYTCASLNACLVNWAIIRHIVTYIGNGHSENKACAGLLDKYGIIKVPCLLPIYCYQR